MSLHCPKCESVVFNLRNGECLNCRIATLEAERDEALRKVADAGLLMDLAASMNLSCELTADQILRFALNQIRWHNKHPGKIPLTVYTAREASE